MSLPAYFVGADVALKTTILMTLIVSRLPGVPARNAMANPDSGTKQTPLPFAMRKSYMRFLMTSKPVCVAVLLAGTRVALGAPADHYRPQLQTGLLPQDRVHLRLPLVPRCRPHGIFHCTEAGQGRVQQRS